LEYIGVQKEIQMIYVYFTGVSADYVSVTVVWFEAREEEWHLFSSGSSIQQHVIHKEGVKYKAMLLISMVNCNL
jgi:hypothetical protein